MQRGQRRKQQGGEEGEGQSHLVFGPFLGALGLCVRCRRSRRLCALHEFQGLLIDRHVAGDARVVRLTLVGFQVGRGASP